MTVVGFAAAAGHKNTLPATGNACIQQRFYGYKREGPDMRYTETETPATAGDAIASATTEVIVGAPYSNICCI